MGHSSLDDEQSRTLLAALADPASRADPYPLYDRLRERPIWRNAGGAYLLARYHDVSRLLRDPRLSSDPVNSAQGGSALSFLNMDPPEHDRLRRIAMRHFGPPENAYRIERLTPTLETMADELIDSFQGRSEIETIAGFAHLLPLRIVAALIGIPREDDELLDAWAEAIAHATDRDAEYRSKAAERAFHELVSYMSKLIARRRGKAGEDLISCLVNAEGSDGTLRLDELIRIAVLLLLAGLETTVNLIGNGILTLLRNPEELERLRNDPFRASTLVEELLRFEPPVHVLYRGTLSDIEVGGAVVPEGSAVQLMLGAANRDPGRFPNADLFLPDRADNQHLGFGSGIHSCFGAPLARLETQIALVAFTRRLISPRLVQDPPPYRFNLTLRGPSELRVAVEGIRPLAVS